MNNIKLLWAQVLSFTLIIPAGQLAAYPETDAEFALLPPYCKARFGRTNSADAERWKRSIGGKTWTHIHHYCNGLNHINKANVAQDSKTRTRELNTALHSLSGVQEDFPHNSVFQPEIRTQKGRVYLRLNQYGAALKEFQDAIKLNPKYTPAYSEISDYYRDNNNHEQARKILEQGLKYAPNSKALKRRLNNLK